MGTTANGWLKVLIVLIVAALIAACFPGPLDCSHPNAQCGGDTATMTLDATDATGDGLGDSTSLPNDATDATSDGDGATVGTDTAPTDGSDLTDGTVATDTDGFDSDTPDGPAEDSDSTPTETLVDADVTETNVCGGIGTVGPGVPGEPCGPCLDGAWECDPADPNRRTTRCEGASAVDACGGCGLAHPLGDACGDCGTWACAVGGSTEVVCVEPGGGCPIILTCDDLTCDIVSRECIESDGVEDASCGDCLATHVLVTGACVPRLIAPTGLTASTDRSADVEVAWSAAANATGYRVYRCDAADCSAAASWSELTTEPQVATTYIDTSAAAPGTASAPSAVDATRTLADRVDVSWSAVTAPLAPRYRYRVTTVGAAGESVPSNAVQGARAERPVTGYEVQVDDGTWTVAPGGLVTSWSDGGAAAPTLDAGTASASLGTFAGFVRLSASGAGTTAGAARAYRVRALTAYGPAAASSVASGWRVAGALGYRWERSADASAEDFATIVGATSSTFDDTGAPADGSTRWYRVVVSAAGAVEATSAAVAGSRQGPPGVPGGLRASQDLADRVLVEWQAVSDAIGYHVYRDGVKLTTGSGVTSTSYVDFGAPAPVSSWAAPTGVTATTNSTATVTVQWVAPTRPVGAAVAYRVSAVNVAGEGALSSESSGNRAALELVGYEVETTPTGGNTTWLATGSTATSFNHATAPAGAITVGTSNVTQGEHLGFVRLTSVGASVSAGVDVTYRVRGVLLGGTTYTPNSGTAIGRRAVGALTLQWQRSAGTTASDFTNLSGAIAARFDDTGAPVDGGKRWYQLVLGATGAPTMTVGLEVGWRLAFVDVTTGAGHTCALTNDGRVWCWGANSLGSLGVGDTQPHSGPVPVAMPEGVAFESVAAGLAHTCAASSVGEVWCWGWNMYGQIGDDSLVDRSLPTRALGLPAVIDINAGVYSSYAVLVSSQARAWGSNLNGKLGDNTTVDRRTPVSVLASGGSPLSNVLQVVGAESHACGRLTSSVVCWGTGTGGQLGQGASASSMAPVAVSGLSAVAELGAGRNHTCARLDSGGVRCWGANGGGQLGDNSTSTRNAPVPVTDLAFVGELAIATATSCARVGTTVVYCWGLDFYGTLGNGGNEPGTDAWTPVQVAGLVAPTAIGAGPYASHVCAVDGYGVKCWGRNNAGQLGDGTTTNRTSPVAVVFP